MAYFPMFVELSGSRVLIVGGGKVALRKAYKLLPYGADITVVAPDICRELEELSGVHIVKESFSDDMLNSCDMVIAATDDRELNARISKLCGEAKIPVNAVDDAALCSFLFPCLVKKGELSIGISTGGASPTAAISFKEKIEELVPEGIDGILEYLGDIRAEVKELFPDEALRSRIFRELFNRCITAGRPLTDAETKECFCDVR